MVRETIERITEIEKKARGIIEAAEVKRAHLLAAAREQAAARHDAACVDAGREARELVAQAAAAAEKEKKALELASQVEIEQLHQRTAPKLTEAKKICR